MIKDKLLFYMSLILIALAVIIFLIGEFKISCLLIFISVITIWLSTMDEDNDNTNGNFQLN